jgi:hypothetical protein
MTQELFIVIEDGQVVVNWESLELVTSKEFIEKVNSILFESPSAEIIEVYTTKNFVNVLIYSTLSYITVSYLGITESVSTHFINLHELKKFHSHATGKGWL